MNILWDGTIQALYPGGGVSRYCVELLRGLAGFPGDRVLAVFPTGAPGFPFSHPSLRQISLRSLDGLNRFRMRRFRPALCHCSYYAPPLLGGMPAVATVYDFIDARFPALAPNGTGFVHRQRQRIEQSDFLVAISETTRRDIVRFTDADPSRCRVAYPPLAETFRQALPTDAETEGVRRRWTAGKPYWLWVGPRGSYKNFTTFLEAFARLSSECDTHLVIVSGTQPRLTPAEETLVLRARLHDRIHVLPRMDDHDLRHLYAAALALVQSSCWEGFGLPLVEALACGTGLVVSDIPAFHEVAGDEAIRADPLDVESWVAALRQGLDASVTPSLRLRRKARTEGRFTARDCAAAVREAYVEVLAR